MRFDQCTSCSSVPRVRFAQGLIRESEKTEREMTAGLEDLRVSTKVDDRYYACPSCTTYFRFEKQFSGTAGVGDRRLVRITYVEAAAALRSKRRVATRLREMRDMLRSAKPIARELAGEALADHFKRLARVDQVRALLRHEDADVRLGATWSFAEVPWASYCSDMPRRALPPGLFDFKPSMEIGLVRSDLLALLCDPDARIRTVLHRFCRDPPFLVAPGELAPSLLRLPREAWSAETKRLYIEWLFPSSSAQAFCELVAFLADPTEEVRGAALGQIYERYSEASIPAWVDAVRALHERSPTEQTKRFLDHPNAGLERDDDPYD